MVLYMIKYVLLIFGLIMLPATAVSQVSVLIVYDSKTGSTGLMAEAVAEGAASVDGVDVVKQKTDETSDDTLMRADAIIVGSPVYNANVTPEVSRFIASWPFEDQPLKDKIGAAFVTAGGISAGEEIVQMNILQSMLVFGMIVVGGPEWTQPFGASAVTGEGPFDVDSSDEIDEQFLEKARALGVRVAETALKFNE